VPNRILKESINESKGLSEISTFAQDLFKRLITYADDYGRFNLDPSIMRARLYARELDGVDDSDIVEAVTDLVGIGKVKAYTCMARHDNIYGYLPNWDEHQRIRNTRAKHPEPEVEINDWYLRRFVPIAMKVAIYERDKFKCQECGRSFEIKGVPTKRVMRLLGGALHIDHIVPVGQGGRATMENLRILCASCNLRRQRHVTAEEVIAEATGEKLPQLAADFRNSPPESNPILIQSETNLNQNQNSPAGILSSPDGKFSDQIQQVYDYYVSVFGKNIKLTTQRREKVKARLKDFTVDQLKLAIDHMKADPWIQGDNDRQQFYATLEYLARNTETVEKWLEKEVKNERQPANVGGQAQKHDYSKLRFDPARIPLPEVQ
jgi:hypothetical protein